MGQVQDFGQPLDEVADVVARSLLAKFAEVGEVFANLGRTDAQALSQLVGRGRQLARLGLHAAEFAQINGQAADDDFRDIVVHSLDSLNGESCKVSRTL